MTETPLWLVTRSYPTDKSKISEKLLCRTATDVFDMLSEHHEKEATKWIQLGYQEKYAHGYLGDAQVEPIGIYEKVRTT